MTKMIVGLGNPGDKYAHTKHNIGFDVLDVMASRLNLTFKRDKTFIADIASTFSNGEKIILVKPVTFMNESGKSVKPLLAYNGLTADDLMVVYDDLDMAVGKLRLRQKGSAGGHNGIKSILAHVGDEHFSRVRIGIGRPLPGWTVVNHVLAAFSEEDAPKITEAINYLIPAVECIVNEDVDMAMNRYNPKKQKKQKKQAQPADMAAEAAGEGEVVHE